MRSQQEICTSSHLSVRSFLKNPISFVLSAMYIISSPLRSSIGLASIFNALLNSAILLKIMAISKSLAASALIYAPSLSEIVLIRRNNPPH